MNTLMMDTLMRPMKATALEPAHAERIATARARVEGLDAEKAKAEADLNVTLAEVYLTGQYPLHVCAEAAGTSPTTLSRLIKSAVRSNYR